MTERDPRFDPRQPRGGADDPHRYRDSPGQGYPSRDTYRDLPGGDRGHGARNPQPGDENHRQPPPPLPPLPPRAAPRHPGEANYPSEDPAPGADRRARRTPLPPLAHGDNTHHGGAAGDPNTGPVKGARVPRKITVTRVAAMRGKQLTAQGIANFRRAATADGADKSGLTALTYAYMANFAADAALTVALANTLFFSAATGESKTKVALYLLVTLAPFAVIAPLIGPALDRLQRGRRIALATSFAVRVVLAIVLALNFDTWMLYPAALGMLVMSKSFSVLKSAVTPRLMPPDLDLVRVNSRLQIFGLIGGTTVAGALAGGVAFIFGSSGALWLTALIAVAGAVLSMRIPSWVEVTEGEIATTFSYHGEPSAPDQPPGLAGSGKRVTAPLETAKLRQPLGHNVLTGLWGTGTIKMLIGFLFLYVPFVAKAHASTEGWLGLALAGAVAVAAGAGNIGGNALGTKLKMSKPGLVVLRCAIAATVAAVFAAGTHTMLMVALAALFANTASALAKVSLDASIQKDLPDESRASAFGRSETVLQLTWVLGGAIGVLAPTDLWVGFTIISVLMVLGLLQTIMIYRGRSLIPVFGGHRPNSMAPEPAKSKQHQPRSKR